MKHFFYCPLFLLLFQSVSGQSLVLDIPDANFKKALIAYPNNVDKNGNGEIEISEAQSISSLYLAPGYLITYAAKPIRNISGIQAFTSLTLLECSSNQIDTLDVSQNTLLQNLYCNNNLLTALSLGINSVLSEVQCTSNQLTSINVSGVPALKTLECGSNQLTNIDVSLNTSLTFFQCSSNKLGSLDLSHNNALLGSPAGAGVVCSANPLLTEICINETQKNKAVYWQKDASASYTTTCGTVTAVEEGITGKNSKKELVKILTLQGQEIKGNYHAGPVIYLYNDGSSQKTMVIE